MRRRQRPARTAASGFTVLEIIVILAVIGILSAVLTPLVMGYIEDSRKSRAEADVREIGYAILKLTKDVGHLPIYTNGSTTTGDADIHLLRGPGNDPVDFTLTQGQGKAVGQTWFGTTKIGELENHLIKNNPGSAPYPANGRSRWRGPYLERVGEDPWGNRYLVNVRMATSDPGDDPAPVWVLSAGPNGKIETPSNGSGSAGPVPGGDDIVARIK